MEEIYVRWKQASARIDDDVEIARLLDAGWEPFAKDGAYMWYKLRQTSVQGDGALLDDDPPLNSLDGNAILDAQVKDGLAELERYVIEKAAHFGTEPIRGEVQHGVIIDELASLT